MKVLLLNGSPNEKGCTYTALSIIADELKAQGVDSEIFWIGTDPVRSCTGCCSCRSLDGACVFDDDIVNKLAQKVREADGYVFGAPVHYSSPAGSVIAALDRLFYSCGRFMKFKPASAIVSARRAGTSASFDVLNKYIQINNMIEITSSYWNMVHGNKPEEVLKDEEGVYTMKTLASNMAWMLKVLESVKGTELEKPKTFDRVRTNFIR